MGGWSCAWSSGQCWQVAQIPQGQLTPSGSASIVVSPAAPSPQSPFFPVRLFQAQTASRLCAPVGGVRGQAHGCISPARLLSLGPQTLTPPWDPMTTPTPPTPASEALLQFSPTERGDSRGPRQPGAPACTHFSGQGEPVSSGPSQLSEQHHETDRLSYLTKPQSPSPAASQGGPGTSCSLSFSPPTRQPGELYLASRLSASGPISENSAWYNFMFLPPLSTPLTPISTHSPQFLSVEVGGMQ